MLTARRGRWPRTRISKLKDRLKEIDKQNETRRQKREALFRVALIGYTNAGKSTLMNALTNADVKIENKLFATLDTTIRRMNITESLSVLLSDTVGFIRKLPHQLVASFRSTLAESANADLLLHIVDLSHSHYEEQINIVDTLLNEIGVDASNKILVFNKVDCIDNQAEIKHIKSRFENAVFISAYRHIGLSNLKKVVLESFDEHYITKDIKLKFSNGGGEHLIRSFATILEKKNDDDFLYLKIKYHKENEFRLSKALNAK